MAILTTSENGKICNRCGTNPALPQRRICRACKIANQRGYYRRNQERLLAQKVEYHKANRERRLAYAKKHREANRERYIAKDTAYYQRNRDAILERARQRRKDNPLHYIRAETLWRLLNPEKKRAKDRRYYLRHREQRLEANRKRYRERYARTRLDFGWQRGAPTDRIQFQMIDGSQERLREYIEEIKERLSITEQAWIDQFLESESPIPDHVLASIRAKLTE